MNKFTYAVSNWIYGEESLEAQFIRLKKFHYDAIELMVENPETFDLNQVKSLIDQFSLPCCSICTMMTGAADETHRRNLIDRNPNVRKRTITYLEGCLDIGVQLGAKLTLTVPSGVANVTDGWTHENRELAIAGFIELGDYAKSIGNIFLAIEPINRYENSFLRRADQAIELLNLARHPRLKMMIDFFHANIEEDNNGQAIRLAGKNVIHCHVADSNRKSTGRGQTDWAEIIRALKEINYNMALACEPLPPSGANVYTTKEMEHSEQQMDLYAEECVNYLRFLERVI
ncbi:MAG: xylose isomerase [Promethearchaeota archaeon CR_4]|nr:MAG: xylose isomerase [Candidatus Lokiarchaeota archaeon CR_4]